MEIVDEGGKHRVTKLVLEQDGGISTVEVAANDLVFFQNGSMTDASSIGSMTEPPPKLTKADSQGWSLWEKVAAGRPEFGNPSAFNSSVPESLWESFTGNYADTPAITYLPTVCAAC